MLTLRNSNEPEDKEQPVNHDKLLIILLFLAGLLAWVNLINQGVN